MNYFIVESDTVFYYQNCTLRLGHCALRFLNTYAYTLFLPNSFVSDAAPTTTKLDFRINVSLGRLRSLRRKGENSRKRNGGKRNEHWSNNLGWNFRERMKKGSGRCAEL